jgi:predicted methyltransferase
MHVKVSKSNAKCFSQASGRGIVVSQKKNLLQSFGWAIKRLPTSSEDEEDAIIPEGQTIGEAVMILILKYCYIVCSH